MEGRKVVGSDDRGIGTVVARHDDCVIVETGHVFKSRHAIPVSFLHDHDGELRATVAKEIVESSPDVDLDDWQSAPVLEHYGLIGPAVVDPDPELGGAETEGARHGVEPAPADRLGTLGGANDPSIERPSMNDRRVGPYERRRR